MRKLESTRLAIAGFDQVDLPLAVFDTYLRFSAVLDDRRMRKTCIVLARTPIGQAGRPDPTPQANVGQGAETARRSVQS